VEQRELTAITALLTNKAYGYPTRSARRRRKPTILACLRQTANATIVRAIDPTNRRFAKDRDLGRLEAVMARLDAEAAAAVVRPSRTPTVEARAYLEELPSLWARTSDAVRHAIAEATFERIDVLRVTDAPPPTTFRSPCASPSRRRRSSWSAAHDPRALSLRRTRHGA